MTVRRYGRRSIETTNEDKVLFPDDGITKGDLIDTYERISGHLLRHVQERPLVLQRFPDGIEAEGFYQKAVPDGAPEWVETVGIELRGSGERQRMIVAGAKSTLAWLGQLAAIELHPWLSRADRPDHPDLMVVDLDPGTDDFQAVRRAALLVRDLLVELGLAPFAKLTGSRGVHVVVPLDRGASFDDVRAFARSGMEWLAERHPEELTLEQRKSERRGRLFLDVGRNAYGQTAVAPYSLRALPGAPIAAPVSWEEIERGEVGPQHCTRENVFRRLSRVADPWAGMRRHARGLKAPLTALMQMRER